MRIARYEKRLLAYFIDFAIALAGALAIFFLIPMSLTIVEKVLLSQIGASFIYFILTFLLLWVSNGYTLGSALSGIRVVRLDDEKIGVKEALVRASSLAIFPWAIINAVNMLLVHTERTLFDRLSDTLVIDRKCY
ncbi:MAG TPA: RDD family protein [Bacilli bacterium]|nr:RDD family protein [Bacilli bacterium]